MKKLLVIGLLLSACSLEVDNQYIGTWICGKNVAVFTEDGFEVQTEYALYTGTYDLAGNLVYMTIDGREVSYLERRILVNKVAIVDGELIWGANVYERRGL